MAQYRIVKMKHTEDKYKIQEKVFGFFWVDNHWQNETLYVCQMMVEYYIKRDRIRKQNPKDVVIKTY